MERCVVDHKITPSKETIKMIIDHNRIYNYFPQGLSRNLSGHILKSTDVTNTTVKLVLIAKMIRSLKQYNPS